MSGAYLLLAALLLAPGGEEGRTARPLTDAELDRVTAGNTQDVSPGNQQAGGVIVGNSSKAEVSSSAKVHLQGSAQREGRALNVVNSAESGVANGANVWHGGLGNPLAASRFSINQENRISQDGRRSSHLGEWQLDGVNLQESFQQTRTVSFQGRVDPFTLALTETQSGVAKDESLEKSTQILLGTGFAGAGTLDVHFSGGEVSFSITLTSKFTATERTCFLWWCSSDTSTTSGSITVSGHETLGEISMQIAEGSGCSVLFGTCSATGSVASDSQQSRTVLVPATMSGAEGEFIAVADARLDVVADSSVRLSDSAQQATRALNLINGASSAIANGINVSRSLTGGSSLQWNQSNWIVQSR